MAIAENIQKKPNARDFDLTADTERKEKAADDTIAHLGIAPGVIETIVIQAVKEVDGVAGVGGPKVSGGIISTLRARRDEANEVEILAEDDGKLTIEVRIQAFYGYRLQEVANSIRESVFDALQSQVGVEVGCINISITGLQFKPESV